jgi:hypothetical protein
MTAPTGPVEVATAAWGEDMPDWVRVLARACQQSSQNKVAQGLGRSGAVVSQVLHRRYGADLARIEERVRGVYMEGQVECPGLGQIALHACQDWRAKARTWAAGNPTRTRMYRACRACPRFTEEAGS